MLIIGVDFHPEFQQIAWVDTDTGEFQEQRLQHGEPAERFYRALAAAGQQVRVGMEASGHARWFERLLAELQFELWKEEVNEIECVLELMLSEREKKKIELGREYFAMRIRRTTRL